MRNSPPPPLSASYLRTSEVVSDFEGGKVGNAPGDKKNATLENSRDGVKSDTLSRFSCYSSEVNSLASS